MRNLNGGEGNANGIFAQNERHAKGLRMKTIGSLKTDDYNGNDNAKDQ